MRALHLLSLIPTYQDLTMSLLLWDENEDKTAESQRSWLEEKGTIVLGSYP